MFYLIFVTKVSVAVVGGHNNRVTRNFPGLLLFWLKLLLLICCLLAYWFQYIPCIQVQNSGPHSVNSVGKAILNYQTYWNKNALFFVHKFHCIYYSHIYKNQTPQCWKEYGQCGSHDHCWGSCPIIAKFWTLIQEQIWIIAGTEITLVPELFDIWADSSILKPTRFLTITLLIAAKMAIASSWWAISGPTLSQKHNKVWYLFILEKIMNCPTYPITAKISGFIEKWLPVIDYLSGHNVVPLNLLVF